MPTTQSSPCGTSWEGMHDHACGLERAHRGPHVCRCGAQQDDERATSTG